MGRVKVVRDFALLASGSVRIQADDIVCAVKTSNYWNQYLGELAAIVTVEGSPTSHPMLIGRERHIPVVIGCPDAPERLAPWDGQLCTLDGLAKALYRGAKPLVAATQEALMEGFKPVEREEPEHEAEVLALLQSMRRVVQDEAGVWYVCEPNHVVSPLCRDLHLQAQPSGELLLAQLGSTVRGEGRVIGGKVCYRFANEEMLEAFTCLRMGHFAIWVTAWESAFERCAASSADFALNPGPRTWEAACEGMAAMMAFKWLQIFARTVATAKMSDLAAGLRVARCHLEQLKENLFLRLPQEDDAFAHELSRLARMLQPLKLPADVKLEALASAAPAVAEEVKCVAKRFKLAKNVDIAEPIPFDSVLRKALTVPAECAAPPSGAEDTEYYCEQDEFGAWCRLETKLRVLHSNGHHAMWRATSTLRTALDAALGVKWRLLGADEVRAALEEAAIAAAATQAKN